MGEERKGVGWRRIGKWGLDQATRREEESDRECGRGKDMLGLEFGIKKFKVSNDNLHFVRKILRNLAVFIFFMAECEAKLVERLIDKKIETKE
ncbi:hypothetical protein DVH24_034454 [Malus domestica]|uniref:Uncharacterized protein n=1 Tax=Malus domestica TaxID=3750 RepID=A0A498IZN1_MALDO|nr:hypothetical protein DVH24_034454 [Malus domestica]